MNQPTEIIVERSITRADGVPRPGDEQQVVAYWHKSWIKRVLAQLRGVKGVARAGSHPSSG